MVPIVDISGSVEHSLEQEEHQNQEERDHLRCTKSIKRYGGCSKTLRFVFSRDILPVYQGVDIDHHQHEENLCEEVLARLDLLKLVRYVWMFTSLSAIHVLLPPVHILRQHFAIEIRDSIEELLCVIPSFLVPGALLIYKDLVMHVCEQICSLIAGSHVSIFVVDLLAVQLEAWIFVYIVIVLDVIPCTNFGKILLMQKQNHQEKNVSNYTIENSHIPGITSWSRELVDANHIIDSRGQYLWDEVLIVASIRIESINWSSTEDRQLIQKL